MTWSPIELNVSDAHLAHQNPAVVQACVPTVSLKGDSYRLKDHDLGARPAPPSAETP
jgi:hypothetical protein